MYTIEQSLNLKHNAIGFIRLFLAIAVIFSHSFDLGGFGGDILRNHSSGSIGSIAVQSFFILSGYLITYSYLNSNSLLSYFKKRVFRIFPAYWVCLILCGFLLYPLAVFTLFGNFTQVNYSESLNFIASNFWLTPNNKIDIGNIFTLLDYPNFNGSLWTLEYEFRCYLLVPLLGIIGFFKKRYLMIFLFLFCWGKMLVLYPDPSSFSWFFTTYFLAGAIALLYRESIPWHWGIFWVSLIVWLASLLSGYYPLVSPFVLTYIVLGISAKLPIRNFDKRYGDYSYGLYIYAFPIQQILSLGQVNHWGFGIYFLSSVALTFFCAYLSWQYIERPLLEFKSGIFSNFHHYKSRLFHHW